MINKDEALVHRFRGILPWELTLDETAREIAKIALESRHEAVDKIAELQSQTEGMEKHCQENRLKQSSALSDKKLLQKTLQPEALELAQKAWTLNMEAINYDS